MQAVLAELSEEVRRKFKKPLKELLVDMCHSIEEMYENRDGPKLPGAHQVYTLVTQVCHVSNHTCMRTILSKFLLFRSTWALTA